MSRPSFDRNRPYSTQYRYTDPLELSLHKTYFQDGNLFDGQTLEVLNYQEKQDALRKQETRKARDAREVAEAPPSPLLTHGQASKDSCPKCGRYVKQGRYLHVKYCQG